MKALFIDATGAPAVMQRCVERSSLMRLARCTTDVVVCSPPVRPAMAPYPTVKLTLRGRFPTPARTA